MSETSPEALLQVARGNDTPAWAGFWSTIAAI
jgi:hypothetical protein